MRWERRIRQLERAEALSPPVLRDHLPQLLERIAQLIRDDEEVMDGASLQSYPETHALARLDAGFDLNMVAREFGWLRRTILELWEEEQGQAIPVAQVRRLNQAIDEAVAVSVSRFAEARERTLQSLDQLSAAAQGSGELDTLLPRLIEVLRRTTEAVDTVMVLLREGSQLKVRASVGLELQGEGFALKVGESFAGKIAVTRQPDTLLVGAETEPLSETRAIARNRLQVLYGVPLILNGEVLGVAHMGSRTAADFSSADKQLFRAMAQRATSLIAQAQLIDREQLAHRQAERALAALDALLAASPVGIAFLDRELRYVRVNEALAESNGKPEQAHLGRTIQEVAPEQAEKLLPVMKHVLETGQPVASVELTGAGTGEQDRKFLGSYFPVRTPEGESVGVGGMVMEITDRARSAELLRLNEERLRLAMEAANAGMFDNDLVTGERRWDARTRALFGLSPDEPLADERFRRAVPPEDRERVDRAMAAAKDPAGGGVLSVDYRRSGADGQLRWASIRGRCLFDGEGRPVRLLGTVVDITDLKRTAEELARTASFREQFIGVLGHDLRNPLGAIRASAELMLRKEGLLPGQRKGLQRIFNSAERMARMISDVLDFARGRLGGGLPIERRRVNLHELCRRVVDELHVAHPERQLTIEVQGDGWGEWDPDRVAQAVSNLVGNALQHGATDAPVEVRVREEGQGDRVQVEVKNQGRPIPPQVQATIFEPFRGAASASEVPGQKSLGLGLWIVQEIVSAHGGEVRVRSNEAEGTRFITSLPRRKPEDLTGSR